MLELAPPQSPFKNLAVCSAALTGSLNAWLKAICPAPLSKYPMFSQLKFDAAWRACAGPPDSSASSHAAITVTSFHEMIREKGR